MARFLLPCAVLLSAATAPSMARACTEIAGTAAIINPGTYCMTANVTGNWGAGSFISIAVNDVVFDCRGHTLHNTSTAIAGNAYGIYLANKRNVHVRNCHITGGFAAGIYAYQDNGLANQNENLTFTGNTISGSFWYGILAYGTGITLRDNRIHGIGGRPGFAMGIRIGGSNLAGESRFFVVADNEISDVDSPGNNAYAIYGNNPQGSLIQDNAIFGTRVHNPSYDGFGVYVATGGERNRITGNTITGTTALEDIGIHAPSSNACFDNLIRAVSSAVLSCDATHGNF